MAVSFTAHNILWVFYIFFIFLLSLLLKMCLHSRDAINSVKGNMKIRFVINKQLNMNTK